MAEAQRNKKSRVLEKMNGVDKGEEQGKREEKKREEKRRVGRPSKVERLARERSNSLPIVDLLKKGEKRKKREKEKDREGAEVFKRSSKVEKSPVSGVL